MRRPVRFTLEAGRRHCSCAEVVPLTAHVRGGNLQGALEGNASLVVKFGGQPPPAPFVVCQARGQGRKFVGDPGGPQNSSSAASMVSTSVSMFGSRVAIARASAYTARASSEAPVLA